MKECPDCGHGVGMHRLSCPLRHIDTYCPGETCEHAIVRCLFVQAVDPGFFGKGVIYCGCKTAFVTAKATV